MTINAADFRKALSMFATGVAIISARHPGGQLLGMTVSSFNSVSLDPPLVLFSIARNAASFQSWTECETFGVSILGRSQDDLSSRFARSQGEKWALVHPQFGENDVPLIPGALANFECARHAIHDGGDHAIFLGRVLSMKSLAAATAEPLLFYGGRYCSVDKSSGSAASEIEDRLLHGW